MNDVRHDKLTDYYEAAESWSSDRERREARSRKLAWGIAGLSAAIALIEAIALAALVPLKREVPYTLLVDRQTGYVEALRPLEQQSITPDAALTRSFLVQYVIARESYDAATLQDNYRKTGLFSAGEARTSYVNGMKATNPLSPLAQLPRLSAIDVQVRSVSSFGADKSLVRFDTMRRERGSANALVEHWAAVITHGYSSAEMSAEDRLVNPLGFQVTRYRRDAESLPIVEETRSAEAAQAGPSQ